ncbi:MAG: DUF3459 domain-containing protein [Verrucomicrobia bacterium]|nr:DUF3459 domain-containing protein [Verrucomicrobiota bacterium]
MLPRIHEHLIALYGERGGGACWARLARRLQVFRDSCPPPPVTRPLSQRDALLITYADQIREPGVPPLRTLAEFAEAHLHDVVSGIHLLPFYPWSSDDGFSVKDYSAVAPEYGSWEDIERLGQKFDLMFDAVLNHMSAQSEWFHKFLASDPAFRDFFVTVEGQPDLSQVVRPRALPLLAEFPPAAGPRRVWTTFSADQVDLNFKNPDVLLAATEALLFYASQGARFIRLDAIAYLWKEIGTLCIHLPQTHRVIQLWRAVLDEVAPHVQLITETNVPHADNLSYFGDGTNEAQLVYNFALPPLVLHTLATGNAEKLTRWAQSLALPSHRVTFFNFLASHDGIGLNPARGILSDAEIDALVQRTLVHGGFISYKSNPDGAAIPYEMNINYLDALSDPATREPVELAARKFLTAQAIMLCLQGAPGIYFHSLFGSRGDRASGAASGINRRINRAKLDRSRLDAELADPSSLRARVFQGYRELLRVRHEHAAFAPAAPQRVLDLDPRVFAVVRESADGADRVLCLHNVSAEEVQCPLAQFGTAASRVLLTGECPSPAAGPAMQLLPHATVWLGLK